MINNNPQKGFAIPLIIAMVVVVLVLSGVIYYTNQSQIENDKMTQEKAVMEKEVVEEKEGGALIPSGTEGIMVKYTGTVFAGKSAPLIDYNKADYDAAIASDSNLFVFRSAKRNSERHGALSMS